MRPFAPHNEPPHGNQRFWIPLHTLALFASIAPLWVTTVPPFVDYPNHLARMHVLHRYASSAELQSNYEIHWNIVPYFAMEAVVLPLLHVTDVYTAGRLYLAFAFALTAIGVVNLQVYTTGRTNASSLLVYPILYSVNLGWGFVPFVFGVGLMLCATPVILIARERSRLSWVFAVSALSTALFFTHMLVLGIFGLMVACIATTKKPWFSKDFLAEGLGIIPAFVPSAILWTMVPTASGITSRTGGWLHPTILFPMAFNADYTMAILAALAISAVGYVGWREGLCFVPSQVMRRLLLVVGTVALVVPERVMNTGLVGVRLPYVWLLLLSAGVVWKPGASRHPALWVAVAGATAIFLTRHAMIARDLATCDAMVEEFRHAIQTLPRGASLTSVVDHEHTHPCGNVHWAEHVATYAVIDRDAFVPTLFMKNFAVYPAARHDDEGYNFIIPPTIDAFFAGSPEHELLPLKMRNWRENFDYLVHFHFGYEVEIPHALEVGRGSWYTLFAVDRVDNPLVPQGGE